MCLSLLVKPVISFIVCVRVGFAFSHFLGFVCGVVLFCCVFVCCPFSLVYSTFFAFFFVCCVLVVVSLLRVFILVTFFSLCVLALLLYVSFVGVA